MKLQGHLMSRNTIIATFEGGEIVNADDALLPLYLKRTGDIEGWLRMRAIDTHRTNSRLLKKALRLTTEADEELVLKVHGATITDTYWFRAEGSVLSFDDVRFKRNMFAKLALRGDPDSFNLPYELTPELTNIGSFEKCWHLEDGKWWMIKKGNDLERFSELFICKLGLELNFPMVLYEEDNDTLRSLDFTEGASVNYEAALGLVGDNEDYSFNFSTFWHISPLLAEQYLQITYLDTLCFNMDRHTLNYGILRNVETGKICAMAPNFDNNIALFSRGIPRDLERRNDKLISLFIEFLRQESQAVAIVQQFPIPCPKMIKRCLTQITSVVDPILVQDFVLNGIARISESIMSA